MAVAIRLTIALLFIFSSAQSRIVFEAPSVGVKMGSVVSGSNLHSSFAFGAEVNLATTNRLRLMPYAELINGKVGREHRDALAVGITAAAFRRVRHADVRTFFGGGLGFIHGRRRSGKGEIDLALHAVVGLVAPLKDRIDLTMSVKYMLTGNMNHAGIWMGICYQVK